MILHQLEKHHAIDGHEHDHHDHDADVELRGQHSILDTGVCRCRMCGDCGMSIVRTVSLVGATTTLYFHGRPASRCVALGQLHFAPRSPQPTSAFSNPGPRPIGPGPCAQALFAFLFFWHAPCCFNGCCRCCCCCFGFCFCCV